MASITHKYTYASLPKTERGNFIQVNGDPKGENFLYCNGKQVFIRNIQNTAVCDVYSDHSKETTVAKYSPSRFYIASGDVSGKVRVWDTVNPEHILKKEHHIIAGAIKCIDWTMDSNKICAVGEGRELFGKIVQYDSGTSVGELIGQSKAINCAAVKQTRPMKIATGSEDFTSAFFEGPPFKFSCSKTDHSNFVNCLKYSADGSSFVTAAADGMIYQYDGKTSDLMGHFGEPKSHNGGIYAVCFSPDDKSLLSVSGDKTAKIWDVATRTEKVVFTMGTNLLDMQVGCLWQGDDIITVSLSGYINYLDPAKPSQPRKIIKGHNKPITAVALSSDGSQFYTGSSDGLIIQWDFATSYNDNIKGKGHSNQVMDMVLDGDNLVTVSMDDTLRFTNTAGMQYGDSIKMDSQPKGVDSKNGVTVVTCIKEIAVYEAPNKKLSSLPVSYEPTCVSINPNGTEVAVGCSTKIYIYNLSGGSLTESTTLADSDIEKVKYSPDGKFLAASSGKKAHYYDTSSWTEQTKGWDEQQRAKITCISWSPDSSKFVTGGIDSYLILWPLGKISGKKEEVKAHPMSHVNACVWQDNNTVITCGQDSNVKIWSISE